MALALLALAPGAAAEPVFTDVTEAAGVDYVQYAVEDPPVVAEAPYLTGGAAAGDYDRDGWVDLYVTRLDAPDILFRNQGDGTFADVTSQAGLGGVLPSNGAAWADLDKDGDLDLYVTTLGPPPARFHLFVNDGNGAFQEEAVARGASVPSSLQRTGFSVTFGDYDGDGWPDIHTTEWRYDPNGSHARLLRNLGPEAPGHFEDTTAAAGVEQNGEDPWVSFSSRFADMDADGWPDLLVAGDFGTSRLFWNRGDGTFVDGTGAAGVGTDENAMGSAVGDVDGDGRPDWFVTSIFDPDSTCDAPEFPCAWGYTGNRLYRNRGGRRFADVTDAAGVRDGHWGAGTALFDYDNDGDLDLAMTDGVDFPFVDPPLDAMFDLFVADPMRLWRNDGSGAMTEVAASAGLTDTRRGKGLLTFDYDRDGDLDLFVVNNSDHPVLYRNDGGNDNDWLRVEVQGLRSNTDGFGARVIVEASPGGPRQIREIDAGSHFLGQSEPIAHFGLGAGEDPIYEVRVIWPATGRIRRHQNVPRNTTLLSIEPEDRGCGLFGIEPFLAAWGLRRRLRKRARRAASPG